MDMDKVKKLQEFIDDSNRIVFFGGAGVSTESGIPDFRSVDGLYNQKYDYPPEQILSHTFFMHKTKEFYRFYYDKIMITGIEPNAAHKKLAELEKAGKLDAVVTQNIDGLHQKAGSKKVFELHGSTLRNYCMGCGEFYDGDYILSCKDKDDFDGIPRCEKCGEIIKPDVVLYEEGLDDGEVTGAVNAISNADMLIIGGTSLAVYPAAGFINYFHGKHLVLINKGETSRHMNTDLLITDPIGQVLSEITC